MGTVKGRNAQIGIGDEIEQVARASGAAQEFLENPTLANRNAFVDDLEAARAELAEQSFTLVTLTAFLTALEATVFGQRLVVPKGEERDA